MGAVFMEQNTDVQALCARLNHLLSEKQDANALSGQEGAPDRERWSGSDHKTPVLPVERFFERPLILGIDGMCGAGKSSLAAFLSERYACSVVHADDFFLPAALRTAERLSEPGGNIHYERLLEEVIRPLLDWKQKTSSAPSGLKTPAQKKAPSCKEASNLPALSYHRFSCADMAYEKEPIILPITPLVLIEGSYSLRPEFRAAYDLSVFLSCSEETQRKRILERNGKERLSIFESRWIPMENRYFAYFRIHEQADLIVHT